MEGDFIHPWAPDLTQPIDIVCQDETILVCLKPPGVLSTDEPGGLPGLLRRQLGDEKACIRTVHRLDRVVSGLVVLARTPAAASELSRQIRDGEFDKEYLAVIHGIPEMPRGRLRDLLVRSKEERKTYVTDTPAKGVQEAILTYETLGSHEGLSLVRIHLETGRTHQIRAQFSSRNLPLVGDRKYSLREDGCPIALWSHSLSFRHPGTGKPVVFREPAPERWPFDMFGSLPECKG